MPDIGLLFWMVLSFSILLWLLAKYAWKPIMKSLKAREDTISQSLQMAEKAREDMEKLQASNQKVLDEARVERDRVLKDAREMKEKLLAEAREQASAEASKIVDSARETIRAEKDQAMGEIRQQVAELSVAIAEKLLQKELTGDKEQNKLIADMIKDIKVN